jgi:hypothetical protein
VSTHAPPHEVFDASQAAASCVSAAAGEEESLVLLLQAATDEMSKPSAAHK